MTDRLDKLEAELAAMRPRELSPQLAVSLEQVMSGGGHRWADRMLAGAMGSGLLAACVIIALLVAGQATADNTTRPPTPADNSLTIGAYTQALASADDHWIDNLK